MAAEVLARAGRHVIVVDHMPSVGRKLLLAGRGGLNLTHSEPLETVLAHYQGSASEHVRAAVATFTPTDLRGWSASLGQPTFVGSSGRVFPAAFRATPLLRAWLQRLESLGVEIRVRSRWSGWESAVDALDPLRPVIVDANGDVETVPADAVVLALGGASWPRVGSDGSWTRPLEDAGIAVTRLDPANCGYLVEWSPGWAAKFAGSPLKNIEITVDGQRARGDAMITEQGIEGGVIYAVGGAIRESFSRHGRCTLAIDLHPDLPVSAVAARLEARRPKDSFSTALRRTLGMTPVAVGVLRECTANRLPGQAEQLARLVKAAPLRLTAPMPIDRAISTHGGIAGAELDEALMLRKLPGVFVAGEMLDWDAPTGGYLLQGCFSTGVAAARGALEWSGR
jgi:uncharacterized flavoprotein (TIGR03862 family)